MYRLLQRFALIFSLLLAMPIVAWAQQPPATINNALMHLSSQVGRSVTMADLDNWEWSQRVYPDASLGCPQPGQVYAQVQTSGFQFLLTYNRTVYDYRASNDGAVVILCGTQTAPDCPPAGDIRYVTPRLRVGEQARVIEGGIPNNVRDVPGMSGTLLGEIPPGGIFLVLEGPQCTSGFVWWRVEASGLRGWTPEGQNGEYWLEPLNLTATPVARGTAPITPVNVGQVAALFSPLGSPGVMPVLSPDGRFAAYVMEDGTSVELWDVRADSGAGVLAGHEQAVTSLAFNRDGTVLAAANGAQVKLWDVGIGVEQGTLTAAGATGAITIVTFNPFGTLVAAGWDTGSITLWDASAGNLLATLSGPGSAVASLTFSGSGTVLLSVGEEGQATVWGVPEMVG